MKRPLRSILLVEDNEDDVFFMLRSVKSASLAWQVHVVKDGQAAIDYLASIGSAQDRGGNDPPTLIFLDLKLPRPSGLDVLAWIRSVPEHKSTVAIMLTTSGEAKDIATAYNLGANAYLVKPQSVELVPMLESVENFWFRYNRFSELQSSIIDK